MYNLRAWQGRRSLWFWLRLWLGILLGLGLLVLALRGIRWREVGWALLGANPLLIALAVGTILITLWAKAMRWRGLLEMGGLKVGRVSAFSTLVIGQFINLIFPARLGEVGRVYLIDREEEVGKAFAAGAVVVEKALDGLMLLTLTGVLVGLMPLPVWLGRTPLLVSLLLVGGLIGGMTLAWWWERFIPGQRREAWLKRSGLLGSLMGAFQEGLVAFSGGKRAGRKMLGGLCWSALIWAVAGFTNLLTFQALGLELGWEVAFFLLAVLHVGVMLPSSPGKLGVFHYICVLALSVFAVSKERALGYALVLHLVVYLPVIILGMVFLWRAGLKLGVMAWHEEPRTASLPGSMDA